MYAYVTLYLNDDVTILGVYIMCIYSSQQFSSCFSRWSLTFI